MAKGLTRYNAPWGTWLDALEALAEGLAEPVDDGFEDLVGALTSPAHRRALAQSVRIRNRFAHGPSGDFPTDPIELDDLAASLVEPLRVASMALRALGAYRVVAPVDRGIVGDGPITTLRVLFGDEPVEVNVAFHPKLVDGAWLLSRSGHAYALAPWCVAVRRGRSVQLGILARVSRGGVEGSYTLADTDAAHPWASFEAVSPGGIDVPLDPEARRRAFMLHAEVGPTVVGPWRVESELGRGSSAVVYAVTHSRTEEDAALKLLHPGLVGDERARERLSREIQAMQRIEHPGVVRVLDELSAEGRVGFVMERVHGETLSARLRAHGAMVPEAVQRIGIEVLSALAAAHAAGIIHRDVKPSNIVIDRSRHVRVLDFGVARLSNSATMTGTVEVVGTRAYLAPEQLRGSEFDHRVDLYALGRVLRDCLGSAPVPPKLDAVIRRAMAEDPEARFSDATSMAKALRDKRLLDVTAAPVAPGDLVGGFVVHSVERAVDEGIWLGTGARHGIDHAPPLGLVMAFEGSPRQRLVQRVLELPKTTKAQIGFDGWNHRRGEPVVVAVSQEAREVAARALLYGEAQDGIDVLAPVALVEFSEDQAGKAPASEGSAHVEPWNWFSEAIAAQVEGLSWPSGGLGDGAERAEDPDPLQDLYSEGADVLRRTRDWFAEKRDALMRETVQDAEDEVSFHEGDSRPSPDNPAPGGWTVVAPAAPPDPERETEDLDGEQASGEVSKGSGCLSWLPFWVLLFWVFRSLG